MAEQAYHIYTCERESCGFEFGVAQAFEEQDIVVCPVCQDDKWLKDAGNGLMRKVKVVEYEEI